MQRQHASSTEEWLFDQLSSSNGNADSVATSHQLPQGKITLGDQLRAYRSLLPWFGEALPSKISNWHLCDVSLPPNYEGEGQLLNLHKLISIEAHLEQHEVSRLLDLVIFRLTLETKKTLSNYYESRLSNSKEQNTKFEDAINSYVYFADSSILQEGEDGVGDELPNEFPVQHSMKVKEELIKLLCQHISGLNIAQERPNPHYLDENMLSGSSPRTDWARGFGSEPKGWSGFC